MKIIFVDQSLKNIVIAPPMNLYMTKIMGIGIRQRLIWLVLDQLLFFDNSIIFKFFLLVL